MKLIEYETHTIEINRCIDCPFVGAPLPYRVEVWCEHPLRESSDLPNVISEAALIAPGAKPPKDCPIRRKLTVLRVLT